MSTATSEQFKCMSFVLLLNKKIANFSCGFSLLDINECALPDKGGCEDKCSNYEGGYYCTCPAGFRLMDDDKSCEGTYLVLEKFKN